MNSLTASSPAENQDVTQNLHNTLVPCNHADPFDETRPKILYMDDASERTPGAFPGQHADFPVKTFAGPGDRSFPERWFRRVKKFTVKDDVDPRGGRVRTTVKIYYHRWWNRCRKIVFIHNEMEGTSIDSDLRPPEAQAFIAKLKYAAAAPRH